jgi:NADH-quinone oxidoreductase subunit J
MEVQTVLFYVFAAITVASALRVITARNPVHSALFLVLAFCSAACIWLMLSAEFLAITLVLVYVGAVMVLFLFVVMMLDINIDRLREGFWRNAPVALAVGVIVVLELSAVIWSRLNKPLAPIEAEQGAPGNTQQLGELLYSDYIYPVEIAAVILLVAMVAAIALTLRRRKDSRYNDPAEAVRTQASDRLRIVRMPAESRIDAVADASNTAAAASDASAQGRPAP